MKYMRMLIIIAIIALVGCGVEDVPPEAYQAAAQNCADNGKEVRIRKTNSIIEIECIEP